MREDGTPTADYRNENTGQRTRIRLIDAKSVKLNGLPDFDLAKKLLVRFAESQITIQNQQAQRTVGDLWAMWTDQRAKDGLSNDIYDYNWRALAPHFKDRNPLVLDDDDWRSDAEARFKEGRAPATVHTELARLRYCLKWAYTKKKLTEMPVTWLPPKGGPRNLTITIEEARKLVTLAELHSDHHIWVFICLLLTTGARHTAILELEWSRVDFVNGLIQYAEEKPNINPMDKSWQKGRATAPMGALARKALESAHAGRTTDFVIEHGGKRLKSVREGFANAAKRAGLSEDVTPHTIRHSIITWAREKGHDFHAIASLVGHGDSKTTELNYTHVDPIRYTKSVVDAIDAEFSEVASTPDRDRLPKLSRPGQSGPEGGSQPS
jgi:integrase